MNTRLANALRRAAAPIRNSRKALIGSGFVLVFGFAALAGFNVRKADNAIMRGKPITLVEDGILGGAIEDIAGLAAGAENAQLTDKINEIAAALEELRLKGRFCKDTSSSNLKKGALRSKGCGLKDDRINLRGKWIVNPDGTSKGQWYYSLMGLLFHEGIHALQWLDSTVKIDPKDRADAEWEAYSWELYILGRIKSQGGLSGTERKHLDRRIKTVAQQKAKYCKKMTTRRAHVADVALGAQFLESPENEDLRYVSTSPASHRIEIYDTATNTVLRTLPTGFAFPTHLTVLTSQSGDDVLYITGTDSSTMLGGLATMTDVDDDGLLDPSSLTYLVPPPAFALPFSMALDEGTAELYVMELDSSDVTQIWVLRDTDADGLPDSLAPGPFADSSTFPDLDHGFQLHKGTVGPLVVSEFQYGSDWAFEFHFFYELYDNDSDGFADNLATSPFNSYLEPMAPAFLRDPQDLDSFVTVDATLGSTIEVWKTDGSTLLELLGSATGSSTDLVNDIPLARPITAGEKIKVFDVSEGLVEPAEYVVTPRKPEILGIDLVDALPGEIVTLGGRNFLPSPTVECTGIPAQIVSATNQVVRFIAPEVFPFPSGQVSVTVTTHLGTSAPVGLYVHTDCNGNGTPDLDDIRNGTSLDQNMNDWPDECECGPSPVTYCTAKTNSCGGTPSIRSLGIPSASASSGFYIAGGQARFNKFGLLLYTNAGPGNFPFQGGILCLNPQPLRRTPTSQARGGSPGACSSELSLDMNAFASGNGGGNPAAFLSMPGMQIFCQWWGRDTVQNGSYLSDALQYTVCQ